MVETSKFTETDRERIQTEVAKFVKTISDIESICADIKRSVQAIDSRRIIRVAGEIKYYSPEWIKLHDEYTASVHESQLCTNKVQSKIKCILDIIKSYGQDHQGLRTHLDTYISDIKDFGGEVTPIETRFLNLRESVNTFRLNLQKDSAEQVDTTMKQKLERIDREIQKLQDQKFNASKMFAKWWEEIMNRNDLEDPRSDLDRTFLATVGITALAPHMASRILASDLKSLGLPLDDLLKDRIHQDDLEAKLQARQDERKNLTSGVQKLDNLKHIEAAVGGLGLHDIFEDTIARLYTVQGIWHALRIDSRALLFEVKKSSAGSAEACQNMISRFECLYNALWFALDKYTSEVAKTRVHSKIDAVSSGSTNAGGKSDSKSVREAEQPRSHPGFFKSTLASLFKNLF